MQPNNPHSLGNQMDQQWMETERQRAALGRSYTTSAIITLVLYFVCWLPGLIANLVYWNEAKKTEQLIGRAPEGKGCLTTMLVVFIVVPVALFFLFLVTGGLVALLQPH
jgi:hypothetical protein